MEKAKIEYGSVWDEGIVTTSAYLNLHTGEIVDIEVSEDVEEFEHLQHEFITVNGKKYTVEVDEDTNTPFVHKYELSKILKDLGVGKKIRITYSYTEAGEGEVYALDDEQAAEIAENYLEQVGVPSDWDVNYRDYSAEV